MEDVCIYQFQIRGQADADDLNAMSPVRLVVDRAGEDRTCLSARTDQAGMVGLIRHLHSLGLIVLSVNCTPA